MPRTIATTRVRCKRFELASLDRRLSDGDHRPSIERCRDVDFTLHRGFDSRVVAGETSGLAARCATMRDVDRDSFFSSKREIA